MESIPEALYEADKKIHVMLKKIFTGLDTDQNGLIEKPELVR
jgi:hypothetical protein